MNHIILDFQEENIWLIALQVWTESHTAFPTLDCNYAVGYDEEKQEVSAG